MDLSDDITIFGEKHWSRTMSLYIGTENVAQFNGDDGIIHTRIFGGK